VFSAGTDVSIFKGKTAIEARDRFTRHLPTIADIEELQFPTVAAVQGLCIAAGMEPRSFASGFLSEAASMLLAAMRVVVLHREHGRWAGPIQFL
jgi:enoyl-CoA hydratase/carnithine racemase